MRIELDIDGVKVHHPKPLEDRAKETRNSKLSENRMTGINLSLVLVAASGIAPETRGYEPLVIAVSLHRNRVM